MNSKADSQNSAKDETDKQPSGTPQSDDRSVNEYYDRTGTLQGDIILFLV